MWCVGFIMGNPRVRVFNTAPVTHDTAPVTVMGNVTPFGGQDQGGAWQASPYWQCDFDASSLYRVWFWTTVCGCLLNLASFCDLSEVRYWSQSLPLLDAKLFTSRKWSSTHPCLSSTLLLVCLSDRVRLCPPFLLPFILHHKAAIPGAGSTQALGRILRYSLVSSTIQFGTGRPPLLYRLSTIRVWDSLWVMLPIQ